MENRRAVATLNEKSFMTAQGCKVTRSGVTTDHGFEVREIILECPKKVIHFVEDIEVGGVVKFEDKMEQLRQRWKA